MLAFLKTYDKIRFFKKRWPDATLNDLRGHTIFYEKFASS